MYSIRSRALTNVTSYSACIAEAVMHIPQRGSIHSVFKAAANIVFPGIPQGTRKRYPYHTTPIPGFVLSLNAASTPRMPNGVQLSSPPGGFPFSALRAGMPVIFGAQRLHIEAIDCSLDLSQSSQWNPHIQRTGQLDMATLQKNYTRLKTIAEGWFHAQGHQHIPKGYADGPGHETILTLARHLCGRGIGLTPTGDDILAGWMAAGWLLYGPEAGFVETCRHIVGIARQQTHLLSQCWLAHAAQGNVAEPIAALLYAMTRADDSQLEIAIKAVLAMGATSGYDSIQGILLSSHMGYNE